MALVSQQKPHYRPEDLNLRHKNHNKKVNIAMKALFKRFLSFICKTQNELEPELKYFDKGI